MIRSDDLARAMVDAAVHGVGNDHHTLVLENRDIVHLAGRSAHIALGSSERD